MRQLETNDRDSLKDPSRRQVVMAATYVELSTHGKFGPLRIPKRIAPNLSFGPYPTNDPSLEPICISRFKQVALKSQYVFSKFFRLGLG